MMKYRHNFDIEPCSHSYERLEFVIRKHFTTTRLSYREIAAIVGWSHTQLWSFHKQHCKLQFEVLDRLAVLFREPYLLSNTVANSSLGPCLSVEELVTAVRNTLSDVTADGISYRKIGNKTGISHEWVRCFHIKEATIEVRKLLSLANYIGVPYELSNADSLAQQRD